MCIFRLFLAEEITSEEYAREMTKEGEEEKEKEKAAEGAGVVGEEPGRLRLGILFFFHPYLCKVERKGERERERERERSLRSLRA